MAYKDRNFSRKSRSGTRGIRSDLTQMQVDINIEKSKARELRKSSWWRKKTATGICYYCGNKFSPSVLTMDHLIPLSRGGVSEKNNIVAACKDCNNKKKFLLPVEWDEYIENIINS